MKKIGIISLCGNNNYGNKLQNYALYKYLQRFHDSQIYTIWIENNYESNVIKSLLKAVKNNIILNSKEQKRIKRFKDFNKKYLNIYPKRVIFNNDLFKISTNFNYFVVGSDQVWNYHIIGNFKTFFMLNCKLKKISYAASISCSGIPESLISKYKQGFENIDYISVREEKAKEIINSINKNLDVKVLVDPTMLLNKEEWDKVLEIPKKMNTDKYILLYFLGEISEQRKKEIERIANDNNCEIINLLDKDDKYYECGPSEFLYLEKNAFLICTDSFHACVFAFLFNKPFIVFDREQKKVNNMNSRIDTLISKFKLNNRRYNGKEITKENLIHDYTESYKILERERKKSEKFLKEALNIKDSE